MNYRNCFLIFAVICICAASCSSVEPVKVNAIVPHPASIEVLDNGAFLLGRSAVVVCKGEGTENSAAFLKGYLQEHYGVASRKWGARKIELRIEEDSAAVQGAYSLEVLPRKITVVGKNAPGLFYGVQTLLQLLPVDAEEIVGKKIPVPASKYGSQDMR